MGVAVLGTHPVVASRMRSAVIAVALAALVAASLGVGYLAGSTQRVTTTVSVPGPFKLVFKQPPDVQISVSSPPGR